MIRKDLLKTGNFRLWTVFFVLWIGISGFATWPMLDDIVLPESEDINLPSIGDAASHFCRQQLEGQFDAEMKSGQEAYEKAESTKKQHALIDGDSYVGWTWEGSDEHRRIETAHRLKTSDCLVGDGAHKAMQVKSDELYSRRAEVRASIRQSMLEWWAVKTFIPPFLLPLLMVGATRVIRWVAAGYVRE